jgi:uncharacterized protein with FMN-binding domain
MPFDDGSNDSAYLGVTSTSNASSSERSTVKRITPVILATIAGLGVLATFKTSPATPSKPLTFSRAAARTPATGAAPPRDATTDPTTAAPATVPATRPPTRSSTADPTTAPPTTAPPRQQTFTGDDVPNQYGDVQVQIVVQGRQLVDVQPLQLPSSHQRSYEISQEAAPVLRQEALQAQSAQIDLLSGATFTSESYAQSLQSALDRAGI